MKLPSRPNVKLPGRKSRLQKFAEALGDSLDAPSGMGSSLRSHGPVEALKAGLSKGGALRAGAIAGGLAGLTAGSAGISSLRRRQGEARDDS